MSGRARLTLLLLAILLVAFALRMARIGELRMWGDEAYSVFSAQRSLAAITFEGAENDPHPPLYYYLLHFAMPFAGTSELALRFWSVLPGVATVAVLYLLGRKLYGVRVGLAAAALGALAPFHVYYSQEIRMYALAICLAALSLYFFVRLVKPDWQAKPHPERSGAQSKDAVWLTWLAYALTTLLALYSLYHTAFVVLAQGLFLLPYWRTRRRLVGQWFAVAGTTVLLFLPWLVLRFSSTLGHLEDRAGRAAQALPPFILRGVAALTVGTTLPLDETLVLAVLFFALIGLAAWIAFKSGQAQWPDGLVLAAAVVPIIAVYPLYWLLPILVGRLFALAFVPLALVLARSLDLVGRKSRGAAALLALAVVGAFVYSLDDYYFHYDRYNPSAEDYMTVIQAVERDAQPGDVVLFHANWHMGYFLGHYAGPPLEYLLLDHPDDLAKATAYPRQVWAVVSGLDLHGSEVWLQQHAFPIAEQQFGQIRLDRFQAGTPTRGEAFGTPVLFGNGIVLRGYRINGEPIEAGRGHVTLELDWQAQQKMSDDYTISVRLTTQRPSNERLTTARSGEPFSGARGDVLWAQEDMPPASGTRNTASWEANDSVQDYHALAVPPGTPPGTYAVQVVMYQSATGRAANVVAPDNLRAQALTLGTVEVVAPHPPRPAFHPTLSNPLAVQWNEMALLGSEGTVAPVGAGDSLPLSLYWQARAKPLADYVVVLQLVDAAGRVHPATIHRPANGSLTSRWATGDTFRDQVLFPIEADSAPGDATLLIGLATEALESLPLETNGSARAISVDHPAQNQSVTIPAVELQRIHISAREHRFDPPAPQYPLAANLGSQVRLLGYDLGQTAFTPGEALPLVLYWQAVGPIDEHYAVFIHLLDSAGDLVAQQDNEPAAASAPTTSWLRGEIIADPYTLALPAGLPAGDYTLAVGMYRTDGGQRLPVLDANTDAVPLTTVRIQSP